MTQLSEKGAEILNSSDEDQNTDVEPLKTKTQLPEDGIITQAQMETIAGKDEKYYFVGKTDNGISYKWTYNGSQIQNPVEQKLLVQCTEDGTEDSILFSQRASKFRKISSSFRLADSKRSVS